MSPPAALLIFAIYIVWLLASDASGAKASRSIYGWSFFELPWSDRDR
jgi:hypothetical protein